jgi:hypothetical protein
VSETIMAAWIQAAGTFFPTAALAIAAFVEPDGLEEAASRRKGS